jgi:hypothetical protein
MQQIAEWHDVDARAFERLVSDYRPAVLRGVVQHWPAVCAALESSGQFAKYVTQLDNGQPVDAILMPPAARGEISYNEAMDGFNFVRNRVPLSAVVEQLSRYALFEHPLQAVVDPALGLPPGFAARNPMPLLDVAVTADLPRQPRHVPSTGRIVQPGVMWASRFTFSRPSGR